MNLYSEFVTVDDLIEASHGHVCSTVHRFNSTYCFMFKCGVLLEPGRGPCLKATAWTTALTLTQVRRCVHLGPLKKVDARKESQNVAMNE